MTVLDVQAGGTPVAGAAVYVWHCDREGRYSLSDSSLADENHLRGVQETDASGRVVFRSVFPCRRCRSRRTWCSPTATRPSSAPSPAPAPPG